MEKEEPTIYHVKAYINQRYDNWHEYSTYIAIQAGIESDSGDILHEVIANLLQKPEHQIIELYSKPGKGRTKTTKNLKLRQLDFFVQSMIRTYATSDTAPWLWKKNKLIPKQQVHTTDMPDETQETIQANENAGYRDTVYKNAIENLPILTASERIAIKYRLQHVDYKGITDRTEQKFYRGNFMKAKNKLQNTLKINKL